MNRNLLVLEALFVLFIAILMGVVITIADTSDTVALDVNVSETASISVIPTYLNWTQVATGSAGGYRNLTIKNAGSLNVSNLSAYVDTLTDETTRPYQSGDPADFAAGGVITLSNDSTNYYFVGRLEWNWTEDIADSDWSAVTSPVAWGYHRNTSKDYVWVLGNGTSPAGDPDGVYCNNSAQFAIETEEDLGTTETRTPINMISLTTSTGSSEWAYGAVTTGTLSGHCVASSINCDKIYIMKYDRTANYTDCTNTEYFYNGNLSTGNTVTIRVDSWVPNGVPSGNMSQATLTIYAIS